MLSRQRILINGIVQGVGFRPFVHRLAEECRLGGFVLNSSEGVVIEVEGPAESVETFHRRLSGEMPPLAHVVDLLVMEIENRGDRNFRIETSVSMGAKTTLICPDIAVCDDCLREMHDPADRRYRYPFINCTNCGPRFTIVESVPYDRPNTSMRLFPMCHECYQEYQNPADRRFHAQPNACPECGPRVSLQDRKGEVIASDEDSIASSVELIGKGKILAVRGVGGFHLVVDAMNERAVRELRRRKGREEKPLAMMGRDLATIRKYCQLDALEEQQLLRPARPIVLLQARDFPNVAAAVAPMHRHLGFMLPYAPLHHLLLEPFEALVVTSANLREEPIAIANQEAFRRLDGIADYFLTHDREIVQRCDDSVVRVMNRRLRPVRRSRGYVPFPIFLKKPVSRPILACGGELKNTIALARDDRVFLSQHIGDLENSAALSFFERSIEHLEAILDIQPLLIAHDLHPEYLSTKWALRRQEVPRIGVQHHHAHLASVLAENQLTGSAIGIILDGTGYGLDGTIWGGEILIGGLTSFERWAWLQPFPLPGGEAAIRQPWRSALGLLHATQEGRSTRFDLPFARGLETKHLETIDTMLAQSLNSPLTSSCGRLFDAVSALLGIRSVVNYEAQAAIELESVVDDRERGVYGRVLEEASPSGPLRLDVLVREILDDCGSGTALGTVAARFHWTLGQLFLQAAGGAREETGINRVALSGGVFQNLRLFEYLSCNLEDAGFEVVTHGRVPANDGGLALGQVAVADAIHDRS